VTSMPVRRLGSTGLEVTPLGLGLAALGRPAYIDLGRAADLGADRGVEALERRCHHVLDAASAAGVRYLDAARSYGRAEEFLASWLRDRRPAPEALTVGSKWGYVYVGGWRMDAEVHEVKDHSLANLRRQLAESRALLGPHLDLYQVHSATLESGVLEDRAVLAELAGLRAEGLAVGLSVSGPRQAEAVRRALDVQVDGAGVFDVVQATWNLLEPSAGPALAEAKGRGRGVIVKEALANGRLSPHGEGPPLAMLGRLAARHGVGVDAVALAAALANPWADVVLSGAVSAGQLAGNLAAARLSLADGELEELRTLAEPAEAYWAARGRLRWA
jgi:aryl-alcohol dehydrogenase-like predicted oxidoreductase